MPLIRMLIDRLTIFVCAVLALAGLAGCATPASVEGMVATETTMWRGRAPTAIARKIEVTLVTGGEDTNPLWTSEVSNQDFRQALERSLDLAELQVPPGQPAAYRLEASLVGVDQPMMGFDMTVTSTVDYKVSPVTGDGRIFQTIVVAPYTASAFDSFLAVERLRLANEGSIRENIRSFIEQLIQFYGESTT